MPDEEARAESAKELPQDDAQVAWVLGLVDEMESEELLEWDLVLFWQASREMGKGAVMGGLEIGLTGRLD